jgi:hypothetical protein
MDGGREGGGKRRDLSVSQQASKRVSTCKIDKQVSK